MQKFQTIEHSNSRAFNDLLCFQGLSRAWNFVFKIQGLLKDPMNPVLGWVTVYGQVNHLGIWPAT